ncbi:Fe-S cluster assembly ATPase SufC [Merdibacter massiliensis]|nr:Fe-S cluster assembly ATPase SufC [Merdibacter massiliensis]
MSTLTVKDLHVQVEDKEILKGVNLTVQEGETHALMGPNGNGKSTLLAAIMGNPKYTVTQGEILLDGKDVLAMEVDERSKAGLFLGMQYPSEISGVTNSDFLRTAMNARRERPIPLFQFIRQMEKTIQKMQMKEDLAHRFLNEGFSGGEKKRNEIIQMLMLEPSIAMLDEIDSGLDVDALKIVAQAVLELQEKTKLGMIVVSHYARFLEYVRPTHAHVLMDGKIVVSGGSELIEKIDQEGYEWVEETYHVSSAKQVEKKVELLGSCGAHRGE